MFASRPYWSRGLDILNRFLFLTTLKDVYEIWLQSAQFLLLRSRMKLRMDDGASPYTKLPRSLRLR